MGSFQIKKIKRKNKMDTEKERFLKKVEKTSTCWIWRAAIHSIKGYGMFKSRVGGYAHRAAYELFIGPIPPGFSIDHLCRNKICVNPDHLEAVTHRENVLRGIGPTAINNRKIKCRNGHLFTRENTIFIKDKFHFRRRCRICQRGYIREYMRNLRKVKRNETPIKTH